MVIAKNVGKLTLLNDSSSEIHFCEICRFKEIFYFRFSTIWRRTPLKFATYFVATFIVRFAFREAYVQCPLPLKTTCITLWESCTQQKGSYYKKLSHFLYIPGHVDWTLDPLTYQSNVFLMIPKPRLHKCPNFTNSALWTFNYSHVIIFSDMFLQHSTSLI